MLKYISCFILANSFLIEYYLSWKLALNENVPIYVQYTTQAWQIFFVSFILSFLLVFLHVFLKQYSSSVHVHQNKKNIESNPSYLVSAATRTAKASTNIPLISQPNTANANYQVRKLLNHQIPNLQCPKLQRCWEFNSLSLLINCFEKCLGSLTGVQPLIIIVHRWGIFVNSPKKIFDKWWPKWNLTKKLFFSRTHIYFIKGMQHVRNLVVVYEHYTNIIQ